MIGRLDRYVGKSVVGAWFAALAFMLFLFILIDALLNLGTYFSRGADAGLTTMQLVGYLARYYVQLSPVLFVTVAPFATVIACMFAMSRHMAFNEIAPMLFIGRSMHRILMPVFVVAVLAGLAMAAAWEFAIPHVAESVAAKQQILSADMMQARSMELQDPEDDGRRLFTKSYNHETRAMEGMQFIAQGAMPDDMMMVEADKAMWNIDRRDWELVNGWTITRTGKRQRDWLEAGESFTPNLIWQAGKRVKDSEQLSYTDLLALRELRPNHREYVLTFHRHLSLPLANIVLLLLAVPFAVHFERGSSVGRVLLAIVVCVAYLLVDLTCQSLGEENYLHPIVAAWTPTILFGSLGLVMFSGLRS